MTAARCPFCKGRMFRTRASRVWKAVQIQCLRFDCGMSGPWRETPGRARAAFAMLRKVPAARGLLAEDGHR